MNIKLLLLLFFLPLFACTSHYTVTREYQRALRETPKSRDENRTTILFLIDGLPLSSLVDSFDNNRLPHLQKYFLTKKQSLMWGRAAFPSLTYTNITSILTNSRVDEHSVWGNLVEKEGKIISFENPLNRKVLRQQIYSKTIFHQLTKTAKKSVSFSYFFPFGNAANQEADVNIGLAYWNDNYEYIDNKTIDSLLSLLNGTDSANWPSFLFVHLIGIDALSHKYGPDSSLVKEYLKKMDSHLQPIWKKLHTEEKQKKRIVTLLTSDHGFEKITKQANLDPILEPYKTNFSFINENRFLSFYFKNGKPAKILWQKLLQEKEVAMIAIRSEENNETKIQLQKKNWSALLYLKKGQCENTPYLVRFDILSKGNSTTLDSDEGYYCPEVFSGLYRKEFNENFLSALTSFFWNKHSPDAVVLAERGVSFNKKFSPGEHGGLSPEEMFIPILMRNAEPIQKEGIFPVYEILGFMLPQTTLENSSTQSSSKNTKNLHAMEFSLPFRMEKINTSFTTEREARLFSSARPALNASWKQYWSELLSTFLSYEISFANFEEKNSRLIQESSLTRNSFGTGINYRFNQGTSIYSTMQLAQQWFPREISSSELNIESVWTPEFLIGTKSRILALGFGDLTSSIGLGLLFPRENIYVQSKMGFKEYLRLALDTPVRDQDFLSFFAGFDHYNQNTQFSKQNGWIIQLGASYGLSFLP